MICSRCQHENPEDAKFCEECAAPLARSCSNCGAQLRANAKFCPQCAQPVDATASGAKQAKVPPKSYTPKYLADKIFTSRAAIEGERKQVTVLFADLTGSMELLADRDPEEARSILDPVLGHMMDAVHQYEGTVNQVMGDGIMALFGAPLAQEDHAVRACYAALRMQSAIRDQSEKMRASHGVRIQARVGINSGEVLVRSIGSDLKMDYSAIGQTTHLAARMEQLATGGTTLITPDTLRLVEGFVQVNPLGPVAVKGLSEPVDVYELTGAITRRSRLQARAATGGLSQFVGRQREFQVLAEAAKNAKEGKGQAVAIVGEPGVGKSRLYWEFTHSHHTHDCMVVEASSVSYGKATSFLPVIDLFKSYFQIGERDDARSVREKLTGKLLTLDRRLETLLPPLLALLDQPIEDEQWQQLEPPQRRRQTLDALKQLWLREAQNQPLVLVFEDLHWIDNETQTFLNELLDKIPAAQILLLFNYRPEYQHPWGGKTFYNQLRLDALPVESTEELLTSMLGPDNELSPLKQLLVKRGNPFFLEETVRTLVETGTLVGERGAYHLTKPLESLRIPTTVQSILAARIDRLDADDKRLLQTAAVIGKDVPIALLKAVADINESELVQALGRLQAAEYVYEAGLYPDIEYTFKHALTHEVAYGGLTQERKKRLHETIVDAIERTYANRIEEHIERLAHHALQGEVWDKAVRCARQAGQRAFDRSANVEAAKWWGQALEAAEHLPDGKEKSNLAIDIRLQLRVIFMLLGPLERASELTMQAQELARNAGDRFRTARALAYEVHTRYLAGEWDEALAAAERVLPIAEQEGYVDVQVIARAPLPIITMWRKGFREADKLFKSNIALLSELGESERFGLPASPSVYARSLYALWLPWTGRFSESQALLDEATSIALRVSQPYDEAFKCFCACTYFDIKGDFEQSINEGERGLEIYKITESRSYANWVGVSLGSAYAHSGRGQQGVELLADSIDQFRKVGMVLGVVMGLTMLADARYHAGDIAGSLAGANDAVQLDKTMGMLLQQRPQLTELFGRIHSHPDQYDPEKAQRYFHDAIRDAANEGLQVLVAHCHAGLGKLHHSMGRDAEAKKDLTRACEMFRDMEMTFYLRKAQEDLAALS